MDFSHSNWLLWLIPGLPFLGALINGIFGRKVLKEPAAGALAVLAVALAFVVSVLAVMQLAGMPAEARVNGIVNDPGVWMSMGRFQIHYALTLDPLSAVMILVVTGVGTLIHLYSMGYMHGDPRYSRFFTYLNLFVGSMLVLVLGSNFVLLYVGWELVGACSFLLIGFWFEKESAAKAGMKAFVVNRIGDFGFALGIFTLFVALAHALPGTTPIDLTFKQASEVVAQGAIPVGIVTLVCLLLFWGATGKSAQIPLYVWLPDAMEGPTPVSALIHAATMVTAGVYMVARNHALFAAGSPTTVLGMPIVAFIGALTAIFAASIALVQYDIKKVLAYSTISQLGYMFIGVGVGAFSAGVFHLMTHAFFKACLFLGAGSVMHGVNNEVDMRKMGGLRRYMPITAITFAVSTWAIAGIPPFAGFWSKDLILGKAMEYPHGGAIIYGIGLVTAFMTAFYMWRLYFRIFEGQPEHAYGSAQGGAAVSHQDEADHSPDAHDGHGHGHGGGLPHESPFNMTVVLMVLAALAIVGGFIPVIQWLDPMFTGGEAVHEAGGIPESVLMAISTVVALAGSLLAFALYGPSKSPLFRGAQGLERNRALQNKWYVDEAYRDLFVRPGLGLSKISDLFDRYIVDGLVMAVSIFVAFWGEVLRFFQSGYIRWYAWGLLGGATVLLAWFVMR